MKTRMRLRWPSGGGVCPVEHNGKKSKVVDGRGIAFFLEPSTGRIFRLVMSVRMQGGLRMIPHESAVFSSSCKLMLLWGRPPSGHCAGFYASGTRVCAQLVAPERRSGGEDMITH